MIKIILKKAESIPQSLLESILKGVSFYTLGIASIGIFFSLLMGVGFIQIELGNLWQSILHFWWISIPIVIFMRAIDYEAPMKTKLKKGVKNH